MATQGELSPLPSGNIADDVSSKLMDAGMAFIVIITVIYTLFIVSRSLCAERNTWEIWVLYPLSYVCSLAMCIICILFVKVGGAGRHMSYLLLNDPTVVATFLKLQTADEFVYLLGMTLPKIAILLLYLRIFTERKTRIIVFIVMGFVISNFLFAGVIPAFTICQPFEFKWDKTIRGGHCANLTASYAYIGIPNILIDIAIAASPLPTLYHLQMSKTRKIGIFLTFMAGSLGIITATIRFAAFFTVNPEADLTYLSTDILMFSMIEPCAYFISSCLPGIRPLVRVLYRRSGLGDLATSYGDRSRSTGDRSHDIPLSNHKSRYYTSVPEHRSVDIQHARGGTSRKASFVCLDTVHVDYSRPFPPGEYIYRDTNNNH